MGNVHGQASIKLNTIPANTSLLGGHFVYYQGDQSGTVASANVVQKVNDDPAKWGYNTHIGAAGLQLRDGIEVKAELKTDGLRIKQGGIEAGEFNTDNYIYIWSEDDLNHVIKINNSDNNKSDWRIVAGRKLGIDKAGNLYASNADITGHITASSLTIEGEGGSTYSGIAAMNISGYSIEIIKEVINTNGEGADVNLYPHMYHNGIDISNNMVKTLDTTVLSNKAYYRKTGNNYTKVEPVSNPKSEGLFEKEINPYNYLWFQDDEDPETDPGTPGDPIDGHYSAYYEHSYKVIYDFNDGAVGSGEAVQIREVDPQKYITKISENGITVHPEGDNGFNYLKIQEGLDIIRNGISVAEYGANVRIGKEDGTKVIIADGSISPYIQAGIYIADKIDNTNTILASFTSSEVILGQSNSGHVLINNNSININNGINTLATFGADGTTIQAENGTQIAHLGYGPGNSGGGQINAPYYTLGTRKTTNTVYSSSSTYNIGDLCIYDGVLYVCRKKISTPKAFSQFDWRLIVGNYSTAEGTDLIASGWNSHAEGRNTIAIEHYAHSEGLLTIACGEGSHAEGRETIAEGYAAHAEGLYTEATKSYAHAEGYFPKANGIASHAEGYSTIAEGYAAHAEGLNTTALEVCSHAQNCGTKASSANQTALGRYNIEDNTDTYAVIVGNGTSIAPSNALTVGWSGNVKIAGTLTQSSDRSLKEHISYLNNDAITFIQNLKPVFFNKDRKPHVGFYAQDVESIDQWKCMVGEMNGFKTLGYTEIIAPLVKYCQKLEERITYLEQEVNQ